MIALTFVEKRIEEVSCWHAARVFIKGLFSTRSLDTIFPVKNLPGRNWAHTKGKIIIKIQSNYQLYTDVFPGYFLLVYLIFCYHIV